MKNNAITVFAILSLSLAVFADTKKPILWETAKATPDFMPAAVLTAGEAVERLETGSACTGQFLSNSGVYLTAMHCILSSIVNVGPELRYNTGETRPFYKGWFVRDPSQLPYQTYEIPDSRYIHAKGENQQPLVIALGRGYFELPPNIQNQNDFVTIQAKAAELSLHQEDFTVLKFDLQKPETHSCIPMNEQEPIAATDAWAIGFPENFMSFNQPAKKYVLKAKVFLNFATLKASRQEIFIHPEESWFDSDRLFLLDGQALSGMSGGAVLNEKGQIIGIIIARTRANDAIILKSKFISAELRQKFGGAEFTKNFTCATKR